MMSRTEIKRIRDKYPKGIRLSIKMIDPQFQNGTYTVDFIDDAGQIHFMESGIAAIPEIDEIEYICNTCGKAFSYVPAISRSDNKSFICRVCGAEEALDAAKINESQKEAVLDEIRKSETL